MTALLNTGSDQRIHESGGQFFSGNAAAFMLLQSGDQRTVIQTKNAVFFIERNWERASLIAAAVQNSYLIAQTNERNAQQSQKAEKKNALAFVSYASPDKNIADNLCARLERKGIKVWYAPRDVRGPYAAAISDAIGKATHFVVILSENSLRSEHVLNEIDLAFQGLPDKIKFKPLRIDESMFTSSFRYYLSRQHWMDATIPPLEDRLEEFVEKLVQDL